MFYFISHYFHFLFSFIYFFKIMNINIIFMNVFYVNYLSKKEYEDKIVLVGFNEVDGKEVTMSELKNDINEIRDSKSTFI